MSSFLRIFCRKDPLVLQQEVVDFVLEGVYFDPKPEFEPQEVDASVSSAWTSLTITYAPDRRPVVLWQDKGGELLQEDLREAIDSLKGGAGVIKHLQETNLAFAFEISESDLTDGAWEMLDSLEAYLARRCEGVIYSRGDGFFDADLVKIG